MFNWADNVAIFDNYDDECPAKLMEARGKLRTSLKRAMQS